MSRWQNGGHGAMDMSGFDEDQDGTGWEKYGPLDVREKMQDANAFMRKVDAAVVAAGNAPPKDFQEKWALLWRAWNKLWDRFNSLPGVVGQFRDEQYRRADLFIRTAQAFEKGLADKSYLQAPIAPKPAAKAADVAIAPAEQKKWKAWQWGLLAAVIAGGTFAVYKLWPKRREELEDGGMGNVGLYHAPAYMVTNPPPWATNPELWEQARLAVEPYKDRYRNPQAVTTHIYKQLGGMVG